MQVDRCGWDSAETLLLVLYPMRKVGGGGGEHFARSIFHINMLNGAF